MIKIQLASLLLLLSFAVHAQTEYYSLNSPDSNVHWKVKPQAETDTDSLQLFRSDYPLKDWVDAIVPGTVFSSYVAAGLEKDPNFGDNIYQVDKTKYDEATGTGPNFRYRLLSHKKKYGFISKGLTDGVRSF